MDLGGESNPTNYSSSTGVESLAGGEAISSGSGNSLLDLGAGSGPSQSMPEDVKTNCLPVPYQPILQPSAKGSMNGQSGVMIEGAFRRSGRRSYKLHLRVTNNSPQNLSEFLLKINNNFYGIQAGPIQSSFYVAQGAQVECVVPCTAMENGLSGQVPTSNVILVEAGIKCNLDLFYFTFPVLVHTLLAF